MKLIDLLVQELPNRGGWPEGALNATQDKDGEVYFSDGAIPEFVLATWTGGDWCGNEFHTITASDYATAIITREQYESALAASKKPAWNGEGVPPVGCECEISFSGKSLGECEVIFIGDELIVWKQKTSGKEGSGYHRHIKFLPLRTEEERKRDSAVEAVLKTLNYYDFEMVHIRGDQKQVATEVIDAIAAGKIPGVKLDD